MAKQFLSPSWSPDHDQAMAGAGRVIDLPTPNTTYGPEIVGDPSADMTWQEPGTDYPPESAS